MPIGKRGREIRKPFLIFFFRKHPFNGGFTVAAGLEYVVDYCRNFRFEKKDIDYLKGMKAPDGSPQFEKGFLDYLSEIAFFL